MGAKGRQEEEAQDEREQVLRELRALRRLDHDAVGRVGEEEGEEAERVWRVHEDGHGAAGLGKRAELCEREAALGERRAVAARGARDAVEQLRDEARRGRGAGVTGRVRAVPARELLGGLRVVGAERGVAAAREQEAHRGDAALHRGVVQRRPAERVARVDSGAARQEPASQLTDLRSSRLGTTVSSIRFGLGTAPTDSRTRLLVGSPLQQTRAHVYS